jgi:hypothetical protein
MSTCGEGSSEQRRKCAREATQERSECVEERDEGYNQCTQQREDRHKQCCDWAPCSWFCDAFWWIVSVVCIAWEWIANVVCVAWTTIKEVVCVAWAITPALLCELVDAISSVIGLLVSALEAVLGWAWSAVAFVWGVITSIPGLGPLLTWVWGGISAIWNFVLSIPDFGLTLIGIMPEKKLRLAVICLREGRGTPVVVDQAILIRAVQCAINVFAEQANTRVIPVAYTQYRMASEGREIANGDYLIDGRPVSDRLLDLCCDACLFGKGLGTVGADLNQEMVFHTFWGGARRLISYGAPVVAFTVRDFEGSTTGCSLGPLTDWIVVQFKDSNTNLIDPMQLTSQVPLGDISTLAHEIGHACNLVWHDSDADRLMTQLKTAGGARTCRLSRWEKAMFRASRHVTLL